MGTLSREQQQANGIPAWSGQFWEQDEFGFMSIHVSDERFHQPPSTHWKFIRTYADEDEDSQVFLYRKVCDDCPCRHNLLRDNA